MSHAINNTTHKSIILSRLFEKTKQFKNIFSNMKESSNIMLMNRKKIIINNQIKERNLCLELKN